LLEGVAAGVIGLIAVTAVQLAWGLIGPRLDAPLAALVIVGLAVAAYLVLARWTRPLATPSVLAVAALAGALLLTSG
jgi:chromate transporter